MEGHSLHAQQREPSLKQLKHRARFGLVSKFVHSIKRLLMQCYPDSLEMTSINHAFKVIYDIAIIGSYPDFQLDYHKILISKGPLHNADNVAANAGGNGMVEFKWKDNSDGLMANPDDGAGYWSIAPKHSEVFIPAKAPCEGSVSQTSMLVF